MESAVRRARERAGAVTMPGSIEQDTQPVAIGPPVDDPQMSLRPSTLPAPPGGAPPGGRDGSAQREHWLAVSVAVVAALVVVAGIALAVSAGGGGPQGAAPPAAAPTTGTHAGTSAAPHPAQHPKSNSQSGGAAGSSTTTSTAPPAAPGGPPVIASLSPATGAAGQGVQVDGSNFLSSNGQIVATFNGQVAATSCPAANTCSVTVPPMTGSPSVQVVITTATGASNAVTFNYS
jgi:hypothetical protein